MKRKSDLRGGTRVPSAEGNKTMGRGAGDKAEKMRRALPQPTEAEFQASVVQLAKRCGWLCYHTYDSRKSEAGFPDLVMVRKGVLVFAELKVGNRQPTDAQIGWISNLLLVGVNNDFVQTFVWRPEDWDEIAATLSRRAA